jgi:nucleolin
MRSIIKINNFFKPKLNFGINIHKPIISFNHFKFSTSNKTVDVEFLQKVKAGEKLSVAEYKSLITNIRTNPDLIKDSKIEQTFTNQLSTNIKEINSKELNEVMTVFMQSDNLPSNNIISMIQKRQTELTENDVNSQSSEREEREDRSDRYERQERRTPRGRDESESRQNQIYVSNLPWSARDEDLVEAFSKFGEVTSANVVSDRETGRSRGFGFVSFASEQHRDAALEQNHSILGRSVFARIATDKKPTKDGEGEQRFNRENRERRDRDSPRSYSERGNRFDGEISERSERSERYSDPNGRSPTFDENKTVFVGGLDFGLTEDKIRSEFSQCGNIAKFRLPKNIDGNIKGMCFIEFESESAVDQAIRKTGVSLNGRNIRVNKYTTSPPTRSRDGEGRGDRRPTRDFGGEGRSDFRRRPNSEGGRGNYSRRNMRNEDESD